jgi:arginyl-tRNA synthetase
MKWQAIYFYEGIEYYDERNVNSNNDYYINFIKDDQDDYILWLKENAQKLYYREPFTPEGR